MPNHMWGDRGFVWLMEEGESLSYLRQLHAGAVARLLDTACKGLSAVSALEANRIIDTIGYLGNAATDISDSGGTTPLWREYSNLEDLLCDHFFPCESDTSEDRARVIAKIRASQLRLTDALEQLRPDQVTPQVAAWMYLAVSSFFSENPSLLNPDRSRLGRFSAN